MPILQKKVIQMAIQYVEKVLSFTSHQKNANLN